MSRSTFILCTVCCCLASVSAINLISYLNQVCTVRYNEVKSKFDELEKEYHATLNLYSISKEEYQQITAVISKLLPLHLIFTGQDEKYEECEKKLNKVTSNNDDFFVSDVMQQNLEILMGERSKIAEKSKHQLDEIQNILNDIKSEWEAEKKSQKILTFHERIDNCDSKSIARLTKLNADVGRSIDIMNKYLKKLPQEVEKIVASVRSEENKECWPTTV